MSVGQELPSARRSQPYKLSERVLRSFLKALRVLLKILQLLVRMLAVFLLDASDMEHETKADHRNKCNEDSGVGLRKPWGNGIAAEFQLPHHPEHRRKAGADHAEAGSSFRSLVPVNAEQYHNEYRSAQRIGGIDDIEHRACIHKQYRRNAAYHAGKRGRDAADAEYLLITCIGVYVALIYILGEHRARGKDYRGDGGEYRGEYSRQNKTARNGVYAHHQRGQGKLCALCHTVHVFKQRPLIIHHTTYHAEQRAEKAEGRDDKGGEYAGLFRCFYVLCGENGLNAGLRRAGAEKACYEPRADLGKADGAHAEEFAAVRRLDLRHAVPKRRHAADLLQRHEHGKHHAAVHRKEVHLTCRGDGLHASGESVNDEYERENYAGRRKVIAHKTLTQLTRRNHLRKSDGKHDEREQYARHRARLNAEEFLDDAGDGHLLKTAVQLCKAEREKHYSDAVCNGVPRAGQTVEKAVLRHAARRRAAEPFAGGGADDGEKPHLRAVEVVRGLGFARCEQSHRYGQRKVENDDDKLYRKQKYPSFPENMLRDRDSEWPDALLSANLLIRYYNIFECRCQFEEKSIYFLKFR